MEGCQVALVDGISMGGGASFMVPMKFSVVTEKTVFATPEVSVGFHTDCGFSYMLPRLQGHLGEFLGLTGARLSGKELVAAGLATHFVPSEEIEASKEEGNGWMAPFLKSLKRSSPTSLKITLQSIREGRKQSLAEFLKKEFRITMNILRIMISGDVYEGIRALTIDKDNAQNGSPRILKL